MKPKCNHSCAPPHQTESIKTTKPKKYNKTFRCTVFWKKKLIKNYSIEQYA